MSEPPASPPASPNQVVLQRARRLERERRFAEARAHYLAMLKSAPNGLPAIEGAARTAAALGDHAAAAAHWRGALALDPQSAPLRQGLAASLLGAGELAAAEAEAARLVAAEPDDPAALNLLGVIQKRLGRSSDAIETFRQACSAAPNDHASWYNLGNTLLGLGRAVEAVAPLQTARRLRPKESETARLLGHALAAADRPDEALVALDLAAHVDPRNDRVHTSRAIALQRGGAPATEVLAEIEKAIALDPESLEHLSTKAALLARCSRFIEAEALYRELLRRRPEDVETMLRLGHLLSYSLRRYEEANEWLRRALELRPDDMRCLAALCKSLIDSRYGNEGDHIEEAGQIGRRLLAALPEQERVAHAANLSGIFLRIADYDGLATLGPVADMLPFWIERTMNVGALHNQLGRVRTPEDRRLLVHWHREWGKRVEAVAARDPVRRPRRAAPRRRIRIGIMSSDLRDHPVCYFALPIFEHYDRQRFEIVCYSFYPSPPDRITRFIQERSAGSRSMPQATDAAIAQRIADDDLDILFELGGSTRYNRLEVMAYRAAPIQASWLGYPHSAGLSTIDYILVDPYLKPEDPSLLIEQPFEMPESWVCLGRLGFRDVPIEPGVPEDRRGLITFGTMNNPYKFTPELFALWAEVLRRVDGSRFLFVRPEAGAASFRANVSRIFSEHGIGPERIEFEAVRGRHLPHYNRIDIALDTAPHTGGTTTCETLWMGVPTVTLVGEAFFERLSFSNLSNAGLGDLCARTNAQYVEIATSLAADRARRLDLRQGLRSALGTLPLGDTRRWVRNFETIVEQTVARGRSPASAALAAPAA